MPDSTTLAVQFASSLAVGLQAALPVLALVAGAALAASFLQAALGFGDPAVGFAFRVAGAVAALAVFGPWTIRLVVGYWQWAWKLVGGVMGGGG